MNICQVGWKRGWNASRRIGGLGCLSSSWRINDAASVAFEVDGFSRRTCLLAARALRAHS
jgi:hypothetical protein